MRRAIWTTAFTTLTAAAVLAAAGTAIADGPTPTQLQAHGWSCFVPPPFPGTIVCGNPAHGLPPVPADPNGRPSYSFLLFDLEGNLTGNVHMIRADLYAGEPCPQTGGPYVFNPANGYYRCGL